MEKNDLLNNSFYYYPKSSNHKIVWKKNDNVKTCDLNSNCTELEFNIRQNKFIKYKKMSAIDDINKENFTCISCITNNTKIISSLINNYTIIFFMLLLLFIVLNLKSNK